MLIPSIDLMGGKIVQLVQGEKKALEFENFSDWVKRFSKYPLVQLIDLDAAMNTGTNRELVAEFCRKLPCQVGGGIHSVADGRDVLECGARKVIFGSSLMKDDAVDQEFAKDVYKQLGRDSLVFAVDSRSGWVAIHGWKTVTEIDPAAMMQLLDPFCSGFLYTHIDGEGMMQGIPLDVIRGLRQQTSHRMIAAGGIRSQKEVEELDEIGVDAVVGMAIYSGLIPI